MGHRATWLAVLSLSSVGCLSNTNNPPPSDDSGAFEFDAGMADFDTGTPDTSTPPQPDATVIEAGTPDAGVADSSPPIVTVDAADAGPAPVSLVVLGPSGLPEANVGVVFSDASGAVLSFATTPATGTLTEVLAPGSQVTVLFGTASSPTLLTIVGVQPGDKLTAIDTSSAPAEVAQPVAVGGLSTSFPDGGADFAVTAGACGIGDDQSFPGAAFDFTITNGCESAGKFPLLATATDANGSPLAFTFLKGTAIATDGGFDDAGNQDVSMASAPAWAPTVSLIVSDTNVPAQIFPGITFNEVAGGVSSSSFASELEDLGNGVQSTTFATHPGYADFVQMETSYFPPSTTNGDSQGSPFVAIATRTSPSSPTTAFDLSTAPPALTSSVVDYANVAQPSLGWTSAAPITTAAGSILNLTWSTDSETSVVGSWTFVAPATTTLLQAPALPTQVAAWAPVQGASFGIPTVVLFWGTFWSGYDEFRSTSATVTSGQVNALFACVESDGSETAPGCIPPLPANGTVQISTFYQQAFVE